MWMTRFGALLVQANSPGMLTLMRKTMACICGALVMVDSPEWHLRLV
jgi:hypothetical protein